MADIESGHNHNHDNCSHSNHNNTDKQKQQQVNGQNEVNQVRKKKGKKSFIHNQEFGSFIVIFTVAMPTSCIILEFFYFNESMKQNQSEYVIMTMLMFFTYFMAMWSYYQAVTIKNDVVMRPPPPPDNRNIDPVYKNSDSCRTCSAWKPPRTHHCSQCGKCALKMDHHCPWIVNCVGLRNHRAFYLFSFYMATGGLQYMWRSWVFFQIQYYSPIFFQYNAMFYIWWTITSVVLYPTGIMLTFLCLYHTSLIIMNQTTLESMQHPNQQSCLCMPDSSTKIKNINLYDRGFFANIGWFFDYQLFTWWMPLEKQTDNDGTIFDINPQPTLYDINLYNGQAPMDLNTQFNLDEINVNFKEFIIKAREQYKGKRIQFDEKIIEVE